MNYYVEIYFEEELDDGDIEEHLIEDYRVGSFEDVYSFKRGIMADMLSNYDKAWSYGVIREDDYDGKVLITFYNDPTFFDETEGERI